MRDGGRASTHNLSIAKSSMINLLIANIHQGVHHFNYIINSVQEIFLPFLNVSILRGLTTGLG